MANQMQTHEQMNDYMRECARNACVSAGIDPTEEVLSEVLDLIALSVVYG